MTRSNAFAIRILEESGLCGNPFPGSPCEGEPEDAAEIALHELCHIVQIHPLDSFGFTPGESQSELDIDISHYCKSNNFRLNLHEARAIAIECILVDRLGLRMSTESIQMSGAQNMTFDGKRGAWFKNRFELQRIFDNAMRTPRVRRLADRLFAWVVSQC